MKNFLSKLKILFTIPLWCVVILCIFSAVALGLIFSYGLEEVFYAYIVYLISAYALTALVLYCVHTLPSTINIVKSKLSSNKYVCKLSSDELLKVKFKLYLSSVISFLYIFVNIFSAVYYKTAWFGIFAFYYIILTAMKFVLSLFVHKNPLGTNTVGEIKCTKVCSLVMLTLNFTLTAAVLMMLFQGKGAEPKGVLIYLIALYTFYSLITAITYVIKYRKLNNFVVFTTGVISFAEALVSMLLLETSMLAQFGADNTAQFKQLMIELTGGGIAVIITAMSAFLFIRSVRELRKIRN